MMMMMRVAIKIIPKKKQKSEATNKTKTIDGIQVEYFFFWRMWAEKKKLGHTKQIHNVQYEKKSPHTHTKMDRWWLAKVFFCILNQLIMIYTVLYDDFYNRIWNE